MHAQSTAPESNSPDIHINVLLWLNKVAKFWWLFLIAMVISVGAGQIYLRYTTFMYVAKSKLLIKGAAGSSGISELDVLTAGFELSKSSKTIDNEIQIMTSRPVITKTINKIRGYVTYHRIGSFKNTELYSKSPIILKSYNLKNDRKSLSFYVKMGYYEEFYFMTDPDVEGEEYVYGESFENDLGYFEIEKNTEVQLSPGIYRIDVMPAEDVAQWYQAKLKIEIVGSATTSNIIELSLQDASPEKAVDFISTLTAVYNQDDIDDNTEVLTNSIVFIDIRIKSVLSELDQIESEIERYKSNNEIVGEGASLGSYAISELRTSLSSLSAYKVQQELLQSLFEYLTNENNADNLIPINITSVDPNLSTAINEYNKMFLRKERLTETVTPFSPNLNALNNEMEDTKALILVTIQNLKNDLEIPIKKLESDIKVLRGSVGQLPTLEKTLVEKLRLQSIKEELYLFLLQKREETALSKAVYKSDLRIIEPAKSSRGPVYPKKKLILIASLLLGFFIPLIVISIISIFQTKLESEEVLMSLVSIPILARLPKFKMKGKTVLSENKRSVVLETFRLLRANLNYLNLNQKQQTILVTSAMSGDGKTSIAINLAITIAMSNKKVLVIDSDLRKPKVSAYLEKENVMGLSNYLTGQSGLDNLIIEHEEVEGFSFITSGPIPPNPNEMIMSERMSDLIKRMKLEYDYIIIDMPPVGLVSDALLLQDVVDSTLFIVRLNHTRKPMLKYAEEIYQKNQLTKPNIIINDVKSRKSSYGGYNKVYGSGYYHEET